METTTAALTSAELEARYPIRDRRHSSDDAEFKATLTTYATSAFTRRSTDQRRP